MEFKMAGKVILRAFLVLALIITANLIRPFSVKNVTQHVLYSARSFRFALPTQLREKFDHANYLAVNLSNSVFEADEGIRDFTRVITGDLAFSPIDVQSLEEVNKSATKQKSLPKKSAPAKRINRIERKGAAEPPILSSLMAFAHSSEIRLFELSPASAIEAHSAQFAPLCPTRPLPVRINASAPIRAIEAALTPRKRDCEKRETDQRTRITLIEDETGAQSAIWVVEKSGLRKINIRVSEPGEQKIEATDEEVQTEMMRTEPAPPRTPEEPKASSPSSPFAKYPKDQQ
jgi:hypothetical protein